MRRLRRSGRAVVLGAEERDWLGGLSPALEHEGVGLYHGSPRDPVWEYVLTWEAARDAIADSGTEITIVGHSHVPLAIVDGRGAIGGHAPGGTESDLQAGRWLLNPGSVGQPRDGDPDAAWMLLDLDDPGTPRSGASPYDVAPGAQACEYPRGPGLPDALADAPFSRQY
jgi:diadenosine tetraphosphatase ApaH/serine/threonine PP2A family protein phosphatase